MMNLHDVIVRPLVTEKSVKANESNNVVVFEVKAKANKTEIKQAVEAIFKVSVEKVNVVNVHPKEKRMGRYVGKTKAIRKAYVKLANDNKIDVFAI
ncbi:MAG: 50S ribosomal protein L23 [Erysipelotrichaceae bacterium]|nr:50S ribosomal protein L23 [Erysipelotrichaceae bacterium]MDD3924148.1 50S ribosomal protein L23 [Erysipelotrichaceae bacterium]MDD4641953.1 50S ribosomal protein L23 [Erysipelotrichaceae bacterium]